MSELKIKTSFSNVKKDINALSTKIMAIEGKLDKILDKLNDTNKEKIANSAEFKENKPHTIPFQQSSTGNIGVQSINHSLNTQSFNNHSTNIRHSPIQSLSIQSMKNEIDSVFSRLTSQEFLVFLTIYQLEEDYSRGITYEDLSSKIGLSEGCIRGYVSSIIRKNIPLDKVKINNRTITLRIKADFRELNLKERLTNIYYHLDPNQKRLFS
jgi:DNA-directed RNA polymerase sigma subunit (sigma70/sigma32)